MEQAPTCCVCGHIVLNDGTCLACREREPNVNQKEQDSAVRQRAAALATKVADVLRIAGGSVRTEVQALSEIHEANQNDSKVFDAQSFDMVRLALREVKAVDAAVELLENAAHDLRHPRFRR